MQGGNGQSGKAQGGKGQGNSSRSSGSDASSATAAPVGDSLANAPPRRPDAGAAAAASGRQLRLAEGDGGAAAGRGRQQQQQQQQQQRGKRRDAAQAGMQSVELFSHLQQYRVRPHVWNNICSLAHIHFHCLDACTPTGTGLLGASI